MVKLKVIVRTFKICGLHRQETGSRQEVLVSIWYPFTTLQLNLMFF